MYKPFDEYSQFIITALHSHLLKYRLSVPCIFQLPTILGGVSIFVAALVYFKAALGGESWACKTKADLAKRKETRTNRPPEAPPPRPPVQGATNGGFAETAN